jgi:excisionase family DNA binding protein
MSTRFARTRFNWFRDISFRFVPSCVSINSMDYSNVEVITLYNTSEYGSIVDMNVMAVAEVAEVLRVSERRVRQLIATSDLRAERVGRQWLVHRDDVADLQASTRVAGHPFSPANAWGLLALVEEKHPVWLSKAAMSRLEGILEERGFDAIVPLLRDRAKLESWYVHPSMLGRLADDPRTVRAGASAVDALITDESFEFYVPEELVSELADKYFADTDAIDMNVLVRRIDGPWPFLPGEDSVWPIVAAVDLLDRAGDDRRRRVAEELLTNV